MKRQVDNCVTPHTFGCATVTLCCLTTQWIPFCFDFTTYPCSVTPSLPALDLSVTISSVLTSDPRSHGFDLVPVSCSGPEHLHPRGVSSTFASTANQTNSSCSQPPLEQQVKLNPSMCCCSQRHDQELLFFSQGIVRARSCAFRESHSRCKARVTGASSSLLQASVSKSYFWGWNSCVTLLWQLAPSLSHSVVNR